MQHIPEAGEATERATDDANLQEPKEKAACHPKGSRNGGSVYEESVRGHLRGGKCRGGPGCGGLSVP